MGDRSAQTWVTATVLGLLSAAVIWGVWALGGGPLASLPSRTMRILFASQRGLAGDWDLLITDLDGTEVVNLTNHPAIDRFGSWSSATQTLAFASDREDQDPEVFLMSLDGSGLRNLSQGKDAIDFLPAISPDGRYVAYASVRANEMNVILADIDQGTQAVVETINADQTIEFVWSPRSDAFVYTSLLPTGQAIVMVEVATNQPAELTSSFNSSTLSPSWSPDGQQLVFASDRDGNLDLYSIGRDGTGLVNLTNTPAINEGFPEWSPDGAHIAFLTDEPGTLDIFTMKVDGSERVNLTNSEAPEAQFAWSPDSSKLLYHTLEAGDVEIFVVDADGNNVMNVTQFPGRDLDAIWVP
ncbi:MAG: hypothetical protein ACE5H9_06165 [Anaerolineae bacterium]